MNTPEPPKMLYAAYGANRELEMLRAIVGEDESLVQIGEILILDVQLGVQEFKDMPDEVIGLSPNALSPKGLITRAWGNKDVDFKTYVIRPKANSEVRGVLYSLTNEQRSRVAEWELIEYGWYDRMMVKVKKDDGSVIEAETEGFNRGQVVSSVVDGHNYDSYLLSSEIMHSKARSALEEYLSSKR
jgi:hypothetical protein